MLSNRLTLTQSRLPLWKQGAQLNSGASSSGQMEIRTYKPLPAHNEDVEGKRKEILELFRAAVDEGLADVDLLKFLEKKMQQLDMKGSRKSPKHAVSLIGLDKSHGSNSSSSSATIKANAQVNSDLSVHKPMSRKTFCNTCQGIGVCYCRNFGDLHGVCASSNAASFPNNNTMSISSVNYATVLKKNSNVLPGMPQLDGSICPLCFASGLTAHAFENCPLNDPIGINWLH
ncbi:hypothetical protein Ddc_03497 [Ditylenchus destructor]|nr:hypothetical protein Ddc_03497 [Ditylenchus destructor]